MNGSGTLTLSKCLITNCAATEGNGGGLLVTNGTVAVNETKFISNTATKNGGAICIIGGAVTISNTSTTPINSNSAKRGGGIYVVDGTLTLNGGTVQSNSATYNGESIYAEETTVHFTKATTISSDLYLDGAMISIDANIGTSAITKIIPSKYATTVQVLTGTYLSSCLGAFTVASQGSTIWSISSTGYLQQ